MKGERPPPVGDPRLLDDDELCWRLEPIAWAIWRDRPKSVRMDGDDLMQMIRLKLWRKARDWDPARGLKLTSILYASAKWCWQEAARDERLVDRNGGRDGRKPASVKSGWHGAETDPMANHPARDLGEPEPDVRDDGADDRDADALLAAVKDPLDRQALRLTVVDGLTLKKAGEVMGCTREWVRQRKERALRQLRTKVPQNY